MRLGSFGDAGLWEVLSDATRGELRLGAGKPLALLVYLAAAPGRRCSREHLVGILWSDRPADEARHVLRQITWQLRRRLGDGILTTVGDDLILADHVESDRADFLKAIEQGRLEDALALYRGEFLPAFATPGATGFERWADLERLRLRAVFLRAAETFARQLLAAGQPRAAVSVARRARDADRLNPSAWRLLLDALSSAGDALGALTEADVLEETFRSEELEIDAATLSAIRVARRLPLETPPDDGSRASLVTDLVGRERDFSCMLHAWERARRGAGAQHVHVVGEPGIGKTRLVSDVLARLRASRARVAHVRAYPNHQSLPYGLLGDIVAVIGRMPGAAGVSPVAAGCLVALAPSLTGAFASAVHQPSADDEAMRRRYLAVHELLVAVCDEGPVALVIDDLHWGDAASCAVLFAVLDRLTTERLLVVDTSRPTLAVAEPRGLTIQLSALTEEGVEALVGSVGELPELPWAEAFLTALRHATSGVPLLILDILQNSLDQGLLVRNGRMWAAPRPDDLLNALRTGRALQQRVERLGAEARTVLLHLAIAGGPTPASRLARALRFSDDAVSAQVDILERIGHVRKTGQGLELSHDSLGDVLITTATPEDVRAAHEACGTAIADEPTATHADIVRAAQHLEAADDARALPPLLERSALSLRKAGDRRSARALASDLVGEVLGPDADVERIALLERDLRQRLNRPRRQLLAALSLALVSLGTWAVDRMLAAPPGRPAAALIVSWDYPFDNHIWQLNLTREMFVGHGGEPLPVRSVGHARDPYQVTGFYVADRLVESPSGEEWASVNLGPVISRLAVARGREAREFIVRHMAYIRDPNWAPDGSALVFSRERYDAPGYELAVVERLTKRVHALVPTSPDSLAVRFSSDRTPAWGPDGTRIAFVRARADSEPGSLCWTTADGTLLKCSGIPTRIRAVLAWKDTRHVLVESVSGLRHDLSEVAIDSGRSRVLESDVGDVVVSSNGEWAARACRTSACGPNGWLVGPVGRPGSARPLVISTSATAENRWKADVRAGRVMPDTITPRMRVFWRAPAQAPPYVALAGLTMDGLAPGETLSLSAHWLDQRGQPIQPSVVAAYATEPNVADMDSAGRVRWQHPLSAGRFVFSAGGWRADTGVLFGPDSLGNRPSPADARRIIREALRRWSETAERSRR